jgi:CheY-like chemotaxis protein
MTKRLIELMSGRIGVESDTGAGSVFWIELLRADDPNLVNSTSKSAPLKIDDVAPDATVRTILYVEDSPANLKVIEQFIARRANTQFLSATNAILGIELARRHQPAVILMDIGLPGISGISALKVLREDPLTQHIPVVAVSADAMPNDIERGIAAGFFRYLTKPIKLDEFRETMDVALSFSRATSHN